MAVRHRCMNAYCCSVYFLVGANKPYLFFLYTFFARRQTNRRRSWVALCTCMTTGFVRRAISVLRVRTRDKSSGGSLWIGAFDLLKRHYTCTYARNRVMTGVQSVAVSVSSDNTLSKRARVRSDPTTEINIRLKSTLSYFQAATMMHITRC